MNAQLSTVWHCHTPLAQAAVSVAIVPISLCASDLAWMPRQPQPELVVWKSVVQGVKHDQVVIM